MTSADLGKLINRLQQYQDWRRGIVDEYPTTPAQLGKDIDKTIAVLKMVNTFLNAADGENLLVSAGSSSEMQP